MILTRIDTPVNPPVTNGHYSDLNTTPDVSPSDRSAANDHYARWFTNQFVADPTRGYALMNPHSHDAKYSRRSNPLTVDMIVGAFNGETRRLPDADRKWSSVPVCYAAIPQTADGLAKNVVLDIDDGGQLALLKLLTICQQFGLSAFAQVSESADHSGGHVYVLGDSWQPAALLAEIGQRLALAAGVACEVYPRNADLRLPLMTHLRAPGGPKRFPLILSTGEVIDAFDPWAALATLHHSATYATPEQLTGLLDVLPSLPVGGGIAAPRHRSKVVSSSPKSVISWYLDNFDLTGLLEQAGADPGQRRLMRCPFHDDRSPSLAIYTHDGKTVCRCFSASSNCPCSTGVHFDAFDLYCLVSHLSASEAVTRLVEDYALGKRRELVIEPGPAPEAADCTENALALHRRLIAHARGRLVDELVNAAGRTGEVSVIRATPGLGKTHASAELANKLQADSKSVAIFAPTLDVAQSEWLPRLKNAFVMRSKLDTCTCHSQKLLSSCLAMGYALPKCTNPACPYARQAQQAFGKVCIFQHAHLSFVDFAEFNTLIVDESPLNALVVERHLTSGMIGGFLQRHPDDLAAPLLAALQATAQALPETMQDVRGPALIAQIEAHLDGATFHFALDRARKSVFNVDRPQPPSDVLRMSPQFLAGLLDALTVTPQSFGWGRSANAGKHCFVWQKRELLSVNAYNLLARPAVIVLDGSANELVSRALYAPWTVSFVEISAPISPLVEIVQVTCTASTRHIVRDENRLKSLAKSIALVCNKLGVKLDGGVTYQGAAPTLKAALGGEWLHYGGQRGHNELADARALAVVCSPTTPPAALERKALALWSDVGTEWTKGSTTGAYTAVDPRLQAMNKLHALEELRQAIFRARPLTAEQPMKLLIFTPWSLADIGLTPARIVSALPHHNSNEKGAALDAYHERAGSSSLAGRGGGAAINRGFSMRNNTIADIPPIENTDFIAEIVSDSHETAITPPLPAKREVLAPAPVDPDQAARRAAASKAARMAIIENLAKHEGATAAESWQRERGSSYGYQN